jgi:hypothetical protein
MTGAETMFTSGLTAFMTPAMAAQFSAFEVHGRDDTVIEDVDRLDRLVGHLPDEGAQMLGKLDPRAHDRPLRR